MGTWQDGNTLSRLSLVKSLAEEHRFEIDTTQLSYELREYHHAGSAYFNGHYYSDKAIGSSLIGAAAWAPIYSVLQAANVQLEQRFFKATAAFLGVSVICAALAPIIYGFVTAVAGSRTALLVTFAIVFGTPVFRYSTGYYGHVQAGLYFLAASLIWFAGRRSGRVSALRVFVSSLLLGWMVVTEYPTAVLVPFLGGYAIFVLREQRRLSEWRLYAIAATGGLLAVAPLLWYNAQVFGHPLTTGYQHHATAKFAAAHAVGVSGIGPPDPVVMLAMTVHPLMGIFWQSPVLLLAVAGWMTMWRLGWRAEACLSFAVCVSYLALMSGYYDWSGGLAYTPRHLIPLFAVFAIPLAFVPQRWMALGVVSRRHLHRTAPDRGRRAMEHLFRLIRRTLDEQGHPTVFFVSTIWSAIWPNIQNGLLVRNRGTLIMPLGIATLIPLFVIEAVLVVVLLRVIAARERAGTPERGRGGRRRSSVSWPTGHHRSVGGASSFPATHSFFVRRQARLEIWTQLDPRTVPLLGGRRVSRVSAFPVVSREEMTHGSQSNNHEPAVA